MVISLLPPLKFEIRTWFCNCPQYFCLFAIVVAYNPSIHDQGKMLVLPDRLLCWEISTSDQCFVSSQFDVLYTYTDKNCGEGEFVGGVHILVWRSVQVYHELQELEGEDKGREEVQEIERESQAEEKRSYEDDHVDGVKDSNILSHGACARWCDTATDETVRATFMLVSVEVVVGVRVVQCHAIMDVVNILSQLCEPQCIHTYLFRTGSSKWRRVFMWTAVEQFWFCVCQSCGN